MTQGRRIPAWRAFATLFALALALSILSACGGDSAEPTPSAAASPQPTVPSLTPVAVPEVEAETVIDLASDAPLATVYGADSGDVRSDLPPVVSGDFNADGVADILLGARFADGPRDRRQDAGEAYVILGSPDLPATIDLHGEEPDLTIVGATEGANLGFSAAAADLNSDGVDDLVLGAPFAGRQAKQTGAVYVIFGGAGLPKGTLDLADDPADVTLTGPGPTSFFGDSVATGDVNGDDNTDLMVGATFAASPHPAEKSPGATYVVFGGPDWEPELDMAGGDYDAAIFGAEDLDELGDTVASGDLNDDGFDDIIMTAEAADGPDNSRPVAAEVSVVFGSSGLGGELFISEGDQDVTVLGADEQDTLGYDLAAGDVNGDGVDDAIITARGDNGLENAQSRVGAAYILFGGHDLPSTIDLAGSPPPLPALYGSSDSDTMAYPFVGDVDGDGTNELLLGAPAGDGPDETRLDAGEVYVVNADDVAQLTEPVSIGAVKLRALIYGMTAAERLATGMAVADVNADGKPDLLLVAADANGPDPARTASGRLYVVSLPGG